MTSLAARLYFGLEAGEAGAAIGAGLFAETGPGAVVAGFIGGLVGGAIGVFDGQAGVNAIWNVSQQIIDAVTGQPASVLTVTPDPALTQFYQELIDSGVPANQASQFASLVHSEWAGQQQTNPNITMDEVAQSLLDNVQTNQSITVTPNQGPTVTVDPAQPAQNGASSTSDQVNVYDSDGNPQAAILNDSDGSSVGTTYGQNGTVNQGAYIGPTDDSIVSVTNQPDGSQVVSESGADTSGDTSTGQLDLASDGSLNYQEVIDTSAAGATTAALTGNGASASLNNADVTVSADSSATVTGSSNTTTVGANSTYQADGNNNTTAAATGDVIGVTGTGDNVTGSNYTLNLGADTTGLFTGAGATVNFTGNSDDFAGIFGTNMVVNNDSGSDGLNLAGVGSSATVYGGGYAGVVDADTSLTLGTAGMSVGIGSNLSGVSITGSNATVTFGNDVSASFYGSNDTIGMNANTGSYAALYGGTGNIVGGDNGNDQAALFGTGAGATVVGNGQTGLNGNNEDLTLTMAGSTVQTANGLSGLTVNGSSYTLDVGADTLGNYVGVGATVNFTGNSGDGAGIFGTNMVVNNDSGSDALNIGGVGSSATVYGGGYAGVIDSGDSLTLGTAGATVGVGSGASPIIREPTRQAQRARPAIRGVQTADCNACSYFGSDASIFAEGQLA